MMYSNTVTLNHFIYIIPIIFKSKENLDNNYIKKSLKNHSKNVSNCPKVYNENYIKINNCITLLMDPEEPIQDNNDPDIEICEECAGEINCNKDNIYIF